MDLLTRCTFAHWRLPIKYLSSAYQTPCRHLNNNSASICKIHRKLYERTYPTVLVLPNGASISIQYHEPRKIIKNKTLRSEKHVLQEAVRNASPEFYTKRSMMTEVVCSCSKSRGFSSAAGKYRVVMLRHGESEWNQKNQFCGWFDADLSQRGRDEANSAGLAIKEAGFKFDLAHTSVLMRAQKTLESILKVIGQEDLPVEKSWRLNERHYGSLTGLNKTETAQKYGEEQVKIWRRSFDTPPPPMEPDHPYYDIIVKDPRYDGCFKEGEFPMFESLKLTIARALPYWNDTIVPQMKAGKRILIAAHGNSLRGIVKHLDNISDIDIMGLNLPTGIPFVYELDENLKPVVSMKFLGDEETVKKAMEEVAAQGKAK